MQSLWYQVVIEDPEWCTGPSFARYIQSVQSFITFDKGVLLSEEDWMNEIILLERKPDNLIIDISLMITRLQLISQIEWATVLLFDSEEQAKLIAPTDTLVSAIKKATICLRAVDNTYIYIYSFLPDLMTELQNRGVVKEIKTGPIESLDFPY